MKVETWKCDQCNKHRDKDSNHWFELVHAAGSGSLLVRKFSSDEAEYIEHICGQECLQKAIDRHLIAL